MAEGGQMNSSRKPQKRKSDDSEENGRSDDHKKSKTDENENIGRTILIVNDEWGTAKGGVSTVHRLVAKLAKNAGYEVYVTAVKANEEDKKDVHEERINMILPKQDKYLPEDEVSSKWLRCHQSYFPHLREEIPRLDVIVGHAPITDDAVLCMKGGVFKEAKVLIFNHVIPEDIEVHKDTWTPARVEQRENSLFETAKKVDMMVSVGPRMKSHFDNKYMALTDSEEPGHIELIPRPDQKFFEVKFKKPENIEECALRVIAFGRVKGVEKLKGYDLVAQAMVKVVKSFRFVQKTLPKLIIRGVHRDDSEKTKQFFAKYNKDKLLQVVMLPYGTQDEIRLDLQRSHLCIMASRSEPFGLVGFEAMATGIPTLVTGNSGVAEFLKEDDKCKLYRRYVTVDCVEDVEAWETAIRGVLCDYDVAFTKAQELKKCLRESRKMEQSLKHFQDVLTKMVCDQD